MAQAHNTFGELFKRYRLRSEFSTLSEFGDALAQKGFVYEDSIYSHWQKNVRIPRNRKLLLAIIEIFIEKGGIRGIREANEFLDCAGQGYLTQEELTVLTKGKTIQDNAITPSNALDFLLCTIQSKQVIRTGWKMNKIPHPESVAEHSFQLCVMAMVFADQLGVDREKLIKMALIHDLGEILTGDIVYSRGSIIDIKKRRSKEIIEAEGIETIFSKLGNAKEYREIFKEMTQRRSAEADLFWQIDKLEMAIQALQYEQKTGKDLSEFFINTDLHLTLPFLRDMFTCVLAQRPKKK